MLYCVEQRERKKGENGKRSDEAEWRKQGYGLVGFTEVCFIDLIPTFPLYVLKERDAKEKTLTL